MVSPRTRNAAARKAKPAAAAPIAPVAAMAPAVVPAILSAPVAPVAPAAAPIVPAVPEIAPDPQPELQPSVGDAGVLRVRSVTGRPRYRAGRAFGAEAVELPIAELEHDEFVSISEDPYLIVEAPAGHGPATSEG